MATMSRGRHEVRLEVKLGRQLNNPLVRITAEACRGDLPEVRTVDVQIVVHVEVGVVEDIEGLKPQFKIEVFSEPGSLDKRRIRAPVTRAVNWGQAQIADRTCCRICKERWVCTTVRSDQAWVNQ